MIVAGHIIAGFGFVLLLLNRAGSKWDDPVTNAKAFYIGLVMFGAGETIAWGAQVMGSW